MSKKDMPIEKSHIMMFARSIGDPNPIYYDEDHANDSDVGSIICLLYTSPSPRDNTTSRMPSSA